jgi:hypothetical protein
VSVEICKRHSVNNTISTAHFVGKLKIYLFYDKARNRNPHAHASLLNKLDSRYAQFSGMYVQPWHVFVFNIWDVKSLFVITYFNKRMVVLFEVLTARRLLSCLPSDAALHQSVLFRSIRVTECSQYLFSNQTVSSSLKINVNVFHKPKYLPDWLSLFPNSNPLCVDTHPKNYSNCSAWLSPQEIVKPKDSFYGFIRVCTTITANFHPAPRDDKRLHNWSSAHPTGKAWEQWKSCDMNCGQKRSRETNRGQWKSRDMNCGQKRSRETNRGQWKSRETNRGQWNVTWPESREVKVTWNESRAVKCHVKLITGIESHVKRIAGSESHVKRIVDSEMSRDMNRGKWKSREASRGK